MYRHNGDDLFVIDGHMHLWDASPENRRNPYGEAWIQCFYTFHSALSPAEAVWPFEKFCRYGEETLLEDLFMHGHVDMGILNSTYLYEFYHKGFNTHVQNHALKARYPDRFILCGSFDPRAEEAGLAEFRTMVEAYPIQGLKLYTAEWRQGSRGCMASTSRPRRPSSAGTASASPWLRRRRGHADPRGVRQVRGSLGAVSGHPGLVHRRVRYA